MAFPLASNALSGGVALQRAAPILTISGLRPWSKKMGGDAALFPLSQRAGAVQLVMPVRITTVSAFRTWNGIGGQVYLPSFPQLDRHDTIFPKAT